MGYTEIQLYVIVIPILYSHNLNIMQPYADLDNDSGIEAFETGDDYIKIRFKGGRVYLYTYASAGSSHIEQMKGLAKHGDGLNSYIQKNKLWS